MAIFDFLKGRSKTETNKAENNPPAPLGQSERRPEIRCSFCGKHQDEVRKIIAGPAVYICDECIDLCNDIIAEECDHEEKNFVAPSNPESSNSSNQSPCYCCGELRSEGELTQSIHQVKVCKACAINIWEFIQAYRSNKFRIKESDGLLPCTICRESYDEAELYEPVEVPLYCESCLAELKRAAEERKDDQK